MLVRVDDRFPARPYLISALNLTRLQVGASGSDRVIVGRDGWLSGDRGDDTLSGGLGADVFHSSAGGDRDVILDFSAAEGDRLQLDPNTRRVIRQVGADVVELDQGAVVLRAVSLAALPPSWVTAD